MLHRHLTRRTLLGGLTSVGLSYPSTVYGDPSSFTIKRGINLHHLMNWPKTIERRDKIDYLWPPFAQRSYKIADEELSALRMAGIDFVRLTVDPSIWVSSDEERMAFLRNYLFTTINRLLASKLKVIVDIHPTMVNRSFTPSDIVADVNGEPFQKYSELVARLALYLKEYSPNSVALELFNEPMLEPKKKSSTWQRMVERLHSVARYNNAIVPIVITGAEGNIEGLLRLDPTPFKASNVLYTFHYYEPFAFTHQGFDRGFVGYIQGLSWPANQRNIEAVANAAQKRILSDSSLSEAQQKETIESVLKALNSYLLSGHKPEVIGHHFQLVQNWAAGHGISNDKILLGEFDAIVNIDNAPSRYEWIAAVRTIAEQAGFPWAFWAYKGYKGFAPGGMTLSGEDTNHGWHPDMMVLNALGLS